MGEGGVIAVSTQGLNQMNVHKVQENPSLGETLISQETLKRPLEKTICAGEFEENCSHKSENDIAIQEKSNNEEMLGEDDPISLSNVSEFISVLPKARLTPLNRGAKNPFIEVLIKHKGSNQGSNKDSLLLINPSAHVHRLCVNKQTGFNSLKTVLPRDGPQGIFSVSGVL